MIDGGSARAPAGDKTVLVVGATGATGRLLVQILLGSGHHVRAVVRSPAGLPAEVRNHERLAVAQAALLDLGADELGRLVAGCDAVASCLGHNLGFKGMFGPPRRLVTEAVARLCEAITARQEAGRPTRFVLMNTVANRNRDLGERRSPGDTCAVAVLRALLPPVRDNESAAEHLRSVIGPDHPAVAWVAVRPDSLADEPEVTPYEVFPSPVRGVIFGSGRTSRINVAHFMAKLIGGDEIWDEWMGRMPVIYDRRTN